MEMQTTKSKAISAFVIAILAFSMVLAATPIAAQAINPAISVIEIYDTVAKEWVVQEEPYQGYVGDQVRVTVGDVTPGALVKVYWDSIKAWDGVAGYLAEGYAEGTTAKIKITIPATVQGEHYIVVKDMESSSTAYTTFEVRPKITLDPSKVLPGDTVTVSGSGFAGSKSVTILYKPSLEDATGEEVGEGDGSTKNFALDNKPVSPEKDVVIYVGGEPSTIDYTVNYVTGVVTFETAPPDGAKITADYSYYTSVVSASTSTNSVGTFTKSFKVPSTEVAGEYDVLAVDAAGNYDSETLTVVLQKITLSPTKGFTGATVTVSGRGFTADGTVDIRWYMDMDSAYITIVNDFPIGSDGMFSTTFKVPLVPDPTPPGHDYKVEAVDSEGLSAEATFTVIAPAKITLDPTSGKAGATVLISGEWFTPGAEVSFTFGGQALETSPSPVYADENGAFTTYFDVPDVDAGTYLVKATDTEGVSATAKFKVIVPTIIIKTRATQYIQGDTISIYVNSSEGIVGAYLEITDPNGMVFWSHELGGDIATIDSWYVLASYLTASLPSDAPLGTWNFTAYDSDAKEEILKTNLFTVAAKPSLDDNTAKIIGQLNGVSSLLAGKLDALASQTSGLSTSLSSLKDVLTTGLKDVRSDVAAVKSDLSGVKGDVSALSGAVSSGFSGVNGKIDSLSSSLSGKVDGVGSSLSSKIDNLGTTLSGKISDSANSIQSSISSSKDAISKDVKSSVGDLSTWLIIIGILAAITLVVELAILIRRLS